MHLSMAFLSSLSLSCSFFLLSTLVIITTTTPSSMQVDGRKINADDHVIVAVESLFPKNVCDSSKDMHISSGLKVVSRHGPCSPNKQNITRTQILNQDQLRVNWIRNRITGAKSQVQTAPSSQLLATTEIPANKGDSFGSGGSYVVTVGFGTPALQQTVIFDTGSVVTWIQCQPCVKSCYQQQEQIFDPKQSSTYTNISCTSPHCTSPELSASTCSASGNTCVYGVQYGDNSFSQGYYSTDTLALTPADTIQGFRFGCGQYQGGTFGQVAGLVGLGRAPSSIVSQAESRYGGVFSYCLPPTSSSAGHLAFGNGSLPSDAQYTPMLRSGSLPFYFLELISIAVGGRKLAISPAVFSNAGTIIDSGTTVTHLPPTAYSALSAAFRARMSRYRRTSAGSGALDTCYDFSGLSSVTVPTVVLEFRGVSVSLGPNGIMYPIGSSKACLAFAANGNDTDIGILGNVQQRTFNVVYDVPNLKIGFGSQGC